MSNDSSKHSAPGGVGKHRSSGPPAMPAVGGLAAPVPGFAEIGRAASDLLYGARTEGKFDFTKRLALTTTSAGGFTFGGIASLLPGSDKLDASLLVAYLGPGYSLDALLTSTNQVTCSATLTHLAPGLKLMGNFLVPSTSAPALSLDYQRDHLTLKAVSSVAARPTVGVMAATGHQSTYFGGEAEYDTDKQLLTKWTVGGGYHDPLKRFQGGLFLANRGTTIRALYAHSVGQGQTLATEALVPVGRDNGAVTGSVGYEVRLGGGGLVKGKVDSSAVVSLLYESRLVDGGRVGVSAAVDPRQPASAPRLGLALNLV